MTTGKEIAILRGHEDRVVRVRISPDSRLLATASADKTVRLWDAKTGLEIMRLHGHDGDIYSVAFSRDGKTLVTGSADRTARVWQTKKASLGELISEACRRLGLIDEVLQNCPSTDLRTEPATP